MSTEASVESGNAEVLSETNGHTTSDEVSLALAPTEKKLPIAKVSEGVKSPAKKTVASSRSSVAGTTRTGAASSSTTTRPVATKAGAKPLTNSTSTKPSTTVAKSSIGTTVTAPKRTSLVNTTSKPFVSTATAIGATKTHGRTPSVATATTNLKPVAKPGITTTRTASTSKPAAGTTVVGIKRGSLSSGSSNTVKQVASTPDTELKELQKKILDLEAIIIEKEAAISSLQGELLNFQSTSEELNEWKIKYEDSASHSDAALLAAKQELTSLHAKLKDVEGGKEVEMSVLKDAEERAARDIEEARAEASKLREEFEGVKEMQAQEVERLISEYGKEKETLEESHVNELAALKEQVEQLSIMVETLKAEKEATEKNISDIKDGFEAKLLASRNEALSEASSDLAELKAQHELAVTSLINSHKEAISVLEATQAEALKLATEAQAASAVALAEAQSMADSALDTLRAKHETNLEATIEEAEKRAAKVKEEHLKEIEIQTALVEEIRADSERRVQEERLKGETEMKAKMEEWLKERDALNAQLEKLLDQVSIMEEEYNAKLEVAKNDVRVEASSGHQDELSELRKTMEDSISQLQTSQTVEIQSIRNSYETKLASMGSDHKSALISLQMNLNAAESDLVKFKTHAASLTDQLEDANERLKQLEKQMASQSTLTADDKVEADRVKDTRLTTLEQEVRNLQEALKVSQEDQKEAERTHQTVLESLSKIHDENLKTKTEAYALELKKVEDRLAQSTTDSRNQIKELMYELEQERSKIPPTPPTGSEESSIGAQQLKAIHEAHNNKVKDLQQEVDRLLEENKKLEDEKEELELKVTLLTEEEEAK